MKKRIAFLLALALPLSLCGCGESGRIADAEPPVSAEETPPYEEATVLFADRADGFKLLGRACITEEGLRCDWPASGVEFSLSCEGEVRLSYETAAGSGYYQVYVDGVAQEKRESVMEGKHFLRLAKDLPRGEHTFRVVNDGDLVVLENRAVTFTELSARCEADTLSAAPDRELYIEFIGDSITSGLGSLRDKTAGDDVAFENYTNLAHSPTHSYAYLTAEKLNADYSLVSRSAIGVSATAEAPTGAEKLTMPQLYARQFYPDGEQEYGFARKADVVVCALGTNDAPNAAFTAALTEFAETVREKNDGCKIVFVYGMMTDRCGYNLDRVVENLGGEEEGFYALRLATGTDGCLGSPKSTVGHPSAANHAENAEILSDFLSGLPAAD